MRIRLPYILVSVLLLVLPACSQDGAQGGGDCPDPLLGGKAVCLQIEPSASLDPHLQRIRNIAQDVFRKIDALMPVTDLTVIVREDPANTIPEIGMGGYNPDAGRVIISLNPDYAGFEQALESELAFQIAHEVHHARRRRAVGYGNTLLEALVSEGLADHFAMEVTGRPAPIWSTSLEGESLEYWLGQARLDWESTPYDHWAWFVGTGEIPRWAGYSIGFYLVGQYLADHQGSLASGMYDAPASGFRP